MPDPQRIAFVGDLHANTSWASDAVAYAASQGADRIIQLGDFGYKFQQKFLSLLEFTCERNSIELDFVDGNHEDFPALYRYPIEDDGRRRLTKHIRHLPRGYRWQWGNLRFLALGGAFSVDRPMREPGRSWWPQETITAEQAQEAIAGGPADVLVAHDCPTGVGIPGIDDRLLPPPFEPEMIEASNQHRLVLADVASQIQPRMIWHGHYHSRYDKIVDLGYGPVWVNGLAHDSGRMDHNVFVVDLKDLEGFKK
jgi:hypothetical protein